MAAKPEPTYASIEEYAEDINGIVCYSCNRVYWSTGEDYHKGCASGGDPDIPATEPPARDF